MQGDALTVFASLVCATGGALIAAIAAEGWRARVLWGVTCTLALAAMGFVFRPASINAAQVWNYVIATIPLLTVALVVLAREPRGTLAQPSSTPIERPAPLTLAQESPDISLVNAVKIVMKSEWSAQHSAKLPDGLREIADKLAMHKLTAFGRRIQSARIEPIPAEMWASMEIRMSDHAAVMIGTGELVFRDLQFDRDYVNGLWPAPYDRV